jgi:hypothetical protein
LWRYFLTVCEHTFSYVCEHTSSYVFSVSICMFLLLSTNFAEDTLKNWMNLLKCIFLTLLYLTFCTNLLIWMYIEHKWHIKT